MSTLIVLSCDWSIHRPVELATLVAAAARTHYARELLEPVAVPLLPAL